jgi:DNA-binding IclR family transcriptional regulator
MAAKAPVQNGARKRAVATAGVSTAGIQESAASKGARRSALDGERTPARPLERYIQILEMLAAFPEDMTLTDLTITLDLPKSTVYRLLTGLMEARLIAPGPGRAPGYRLAPRLLQLLHLGAEGQDIELVVQQHLQDLAEKSANTSYLTKLTGLKVHSIVMRAPSPNWCIYVTPGSEMFPHATASAKAIMAFQPEDVIKKALADSLPKLTKFTKTDPKEIIAEYKRVREDGYAICHAEDVDGFGAIACPIMIPEVGVLYSVGMTGPLDVVFNCPITQRAAQVKEASRKIALSLQANNRTLKAAKGEH